MVLTAMNDPFGRYFLDNGIVLYDVGYDDIGRGYIDGIDNDGDEDVDLDDADCDNADDNDERS